MGNILYRFKNPKIFIDNDVNDGFALKLQSRLPTPIPGRHKNHLFNIEINEFNSNALSSSTNDLVNSAIQVKH